MNYTKDWVLDAGKYEGVVFSPDVGTIATISDELIDWKANAQLIASAPDLYEALDEVRMGAVWGTYTIPDYLWTMLLKALSKVEGK